jgi:DNA-binding response OmpR family regulator
MASPHTGLKCVLFVEDHEDTWEIVAFPLAGNYEVICARNFEDGLRLATQQRFGLYILDNWLPDGSGVELCRAIREFDPQTPILFYSAAGYNQDIEEGLGAGAQAYLVKPVSFEELKLAVERLTPPAGESASAAQGAEIKAIRQREITVRVESGKKRRLRAEEKLMRFKAEKAFLEAGGTRGEFARRWPSVFKEEVRSHRNGG